MTENEWFREVAKANFPEAGEIYFSEIDKDVYDSAIGNDRYCVDTDEVQVYARKDKAILFSPSKGDLERCTANVLFYKAFDCVPTSEGQIDEILADMHLSPESERETREYYSERMEDLKANYCKPLSEYLGSSEEVGLTHKPTGEGAA